MRLTNNIRQAFVRAAMADVPSTDYREKARVLLQKDAVAALPPAVHTIYLDPVLRRHIAQTQTYDGVCGYVYVPGDNYKPSDKVKAQLDAWAKLSEAQDARDHELRQKLNSVAQACSSRDKLVKMLPEFEKYLPADETAACRTLPVLANVVTDFMRAGWPKGTAPSAA